MATQSIYTQTVRYHTGQLLEDAKKLCDSYLSPAESTVLISVKKAEAKKLVALNAKALDDYPPPNSISCLLNKAQKKLDLAEKVLAFRTKADEKAIDPRIEKLIAKLTRMMENPPEEVDDKAFRKLYGCRYQFDKYDLQPKNLATAHALGKVPEMVGKIDMQLLQNCWENICFLYESALDEKYRGFYQKMANPLEAQSLSSAMYAIHYVGLCTIHPDMRIQMFGLGQRDMLLHEFMAKYFEQNPTTAPFSIDDLIQTPLYKDKFVCLSAPCLVEANEKEIKEALEILIKIKNSHQLKSMGAFIIHGPKTCAIVFHSSGRISLYDPCGYQSASGSTLPPSNETNFGNLLDAVQFLKQASSALAPYWRIILHPYCDKQAFDRATSQSGAKNFEPKKDYLSSLALFPPETYTCPAGARQVGHFQSVEEEPEVSFEERFPRVFFLQKAVFCLTQSTHEGYLESLTHLAKLKEAEGNPLNRVYFHLDHIQNNETPEKVDRSEHQWGMKAFETESLSTPNQKLRAVQRVLVEVILDTLEKGIGIDEEIDFEDIDFLTDSLEEMTLNSDDLPENRDDPAKALHKKFYDLYVKAREKDPSLDDPDAEKFQNDFGAMLFGYDIENVNDIPNEMRLQAIREVQQDFKTVWHI